MNKEIPSDLLASLTYLYKEIPVATALFDWFARRKKDATEVAVNRAAFMTETADWEVLRVFRQLERDGCGKLLIGRKGFKTRMRWHYSIRSLAAAARGEGVPTPMDKVASDEVESLPTIEIVDLDRAYREEHGTEPAADALPELVAEGVAEEQAGDPSVITHSFQIRPGMMVACALPADVTDREAERLATFIRSLPF